MCCISWLALAAAGTAQPVVACAQVVKVLNSAAATINQNATAYWSSRAEYVDLIFGLSSATVANATQVADQQKGQGDALPAGMPSVLANFKNLAATAQSQGCLSASQLSAIIEPTIKLAKRVNFDRSPEDLPLESTVQTGPPRLPH